MSKQTPLQSQALTLYDLGFNVFPMPYHNRGCMDWSGLMYTRMHRSQIMESFAGRCNLAVMTGSTSFGLIVLQINSDEAFKSYLHNGYQHKISFWAIKHQVGGQIWFRTNVDIYNTRNDKEIMVRSQNRYTFAPPSIIDNSQIVWDMRIEKKLISLNQDAIHRLDIYDVIQIPERSQNIPQYEIELEQLALEENWTDLELKQALYKEREIHIDRYKNRIMFWESMSAYMAEYWSWEGKEGLSELATFCALIRHVSHIYPVRRQFRASQRELAKLAHLQPETVGKVLERFRDNEPPILNYVKDDRRSNAFVYEFNQALVEEGHSLLRGAETGHFHSISICYILARKSYQCIIESYSDVLETAAMGYSGFLVHALLSRQPGLKTSQIADTLGFSLDQTKRLCRKLKRYNIIIQNDSYAYRAGMLSESNIEHLIQDAGVVGKTKARQRKILQEQQQFAGKKIIAQRKICDRENWLVE